MPIRWNAGAFCNRRRYDITRHVVRQELLRIFTGCSHKPVTLQNSVAQIATLIAGESHAFVGKCRTIRRRIARSKKVFRNLKRPQKIL